MWREVKDRDRREGGKHDLIWIQRLDTEQRLQSAKVNREVHASIPTAPFMG
jgi:hypothetical protein